MEKPQKLHKPMRCVIMAKTKEGDRMRICVYGAASNEIDPRYLSAGEALGRMMAQRGHSLVFGGGANGLMGAVARGVSDGGGEILGVAPSFFNVDGVLFQHCTELRYTKTMRERKQTMEQSADAFIMTPGGIGTFEEFFEILTLKQLDQHRKPIAILNTLGYYDDLRQMLQTAVKQGFLKENCLQLFGTFDAPDALLDYLEGAFTK